MKAILKLIEGRKTYIVATLAFVLGGLHFLGYVDSNTLMKIDMILAPLGLAFLRSGVKKNS